MIIIPARLNSSRLPNKVLAKIGNTPMVILTTQAVRDIDKVVIATDSNEVLDIAKSYGIEAIITSNTHKSGTDRVFEAASKLGLSNDDIILNIQADEPFIEKEVVQKLFDLTKEYQKDDDVLMTTCYKIIDSSSANDPNIVKVVTNLKNEAIYFSRSKIPFNRDNKEITYKGHLGLYGYTYKKLKIYCNLKEGMLEDIEKLEQLRVIDNGYKIAIAEVKTNSFGIDTKEDLQKALKKYNWVQWFSSLEINIRYLKFIFTIFILY